ncbi:MAG TPA: serine hydrolase domain-containing protein, partial [Polyangiaceae bacterium]|nr:serine hydrolase domain-containing protein [Polyangiaceae bacterium]
MAAMLKKARVPGCSVAVWRAGAQATANFGLSDVEAQRHVESSTVFHLFSGTKPYTAAAVMLLRERGLVELDGPVGDYVGDLRLRNPISVRQLLSHSSGLADTLAGFLAVHFEGTPMPSSAAALARYRTDQGKRPGRKAAYRNVNYAILGELVTRVSGVPYVQFVQTQLLGPLKSGATFTYNSENQPHAAVGYISRFNPMRWLLRFMMPEVSRQLERARLGSLVPLNQYTLDTAAIGGLLGCATDFLPMASELLKTTNGILSADSKREMLTVQSPGAAGIASRVGVGIGWKCGRHRGVEFWNHEGGGAGFTSETRIYPDTNLAVVILMNATQSKKLSMLAHEICE